MGATSHVSAHVAEMRPRSTKSAGDTELGLDLLQQGSAVEVVENSDDASATGALHEQVLVLGSQRLLFNEFEHVFAATKTGRLRHRYLLRGTVQPCRVVQCPTAANSNGSARAQGSSPRVASNRPNSNLLRNAGGSGVKGTNDDEK